VTLFDTSTVIVVDKAHSNDDGIKVYMVIPGNDVFIIPRFHVPVIGGELFELAGKTSGIAFRQYGPN